MKKFKPIIIGISGTIGLMIIYFGILTWANSFTHALEQLMIMWYWFLLLSIGFGIQLGLYSYVKLVKKSNMAGATAEITATGGVTTGSMIACCAHHIADLLPLIGLSAAAVFLVQYQIPFILLGICSNIIGIIQMLSIIQKHNLHQNNKIFKSIFYFNMVNLRNIAIIVSIFIVIFSFIRYSI